MAMVRISSRQNALVTRYRRVARGIEPSLVLLDGAHLIADALAAGVPLRDVLVTDEAHARPEIARLIDTLRQAGVATTSASPSVLAAASPVRSPSGIVALADRPEIRSETVYQAPLPLVLIASGVQDPGNVGAMVRVAEAAGATGVIVAASSADPFAWKALRGAMGSALRLPIASEVSGESAVADAKRHHCSVVATVPRDGQSIYETDFTRPVAIVIGGEGAGISQVIVDAADVRATIPTTAPVESLNAATAAAVMLFEARRQRSIAALRT